MKLVNLTKTRIYVHHRDLDQSSVAPQPMKKRLTESHWCQYGYANEYSSGILAVVTKEDMLISQEYQLVTTTERLKCMDRKRFFFNVKNCTCILFS